MECTQWNLAAMPPNHPDLGGNDMPEKVAPGPVDEERSIREAVCVHTKKIFDSCREEDIAAYKILDTKENGRQ